MCLTGIHGHVLQTGITAFMYMINALLHTRVCFGVATVLWIIQKANLVH